MADSFGIRTNASVEEVQKFTNKIATLSAQLKELVKDSYAAAKADAAHVDDIESLYKEITRLKQAYGGVRGRYTQFRNELTKALPAKGVENYSKKLREIHDAMRRIGFTDAIREAKQFQAAGTRGAEELARNLDRASQSVKTGGDYIRDLRRQVTQFGKQDVQGLVHSFEQVPDKVSLANPIFDQLSQRLDQVFDKAVKLGNLSWDAGLGTSFNEAKARLNELSEILGGAYTRNIQGAIERSAQFQRSVTAVDFNTFQNRLAGVSTAIKKVNEQAGDSTAGQKFAKQFLQGKIDIREFGGESNKVFRELAVQIERTYGPYEKHIEQIRRAKAEAEKLAAAQAAEKRGNALGAFARGRVNPQNTDEGLRAQIAINAVTKAAQNFTGKLPNLKQLYDQVAAGTAKVTKENEQLIRAFQQLQRSADGAEPPIKKVGRAAGGGGASKGMKQLKKSTIETTLSMQTLSRFIEFRLIAQTLFAFTRELRQSVGQMLEFGTAVAQIQTISQNVPLGFDKWSESLRNLSTEFNLDLLKAAEGAYLSLSNQIAEGNRAIAFNREAAVFAKAAVTDQANAVNLLTAVLNSFELSAESAREVAGSLFKTIELGRVKADEIANTFGRVTVFANQLGVTLQEVEAAMAVLTIAGIPASEAQTQLRNVFIKLITPSEALKKLYDEWGVSTGQLAVETFGFVGVLRKLEVESKKGSDVLAELFTRIRAQAGATSLTQAFERYEDTLTQIRDAGEAHAQAAEIVLQNHTQIIEREIQRFRNELIGIMDSVAQRVAQFQKNLESARSVKISVTADTSDFEQSAQQLERANAVSGKAKNLFGLDTGDFAVIGTQVALLTGALTLLAKTVPFVTKEFSAFGRGYNNILQQVPLLGPALSNVSARLKSFQAGALSELGDELDYFRESAEEVKSGAKTMEEAFSRTGKSTISITERMKNGISSFVGTVASGLAGTAVKSFNTLRTAIVAFGTQSFPAITGTVAALRALPPAAFAAMGRFKVAMLIGKAAVIDFVGTVRAIPAAIGKVMAGIGTAIGFAAPILFAIGALNSFINRINNKRIERAVEALRKLNEVRLDKLTRNLSQERKSFEREMDGITQKNLEAIAGQLSVINRNSEIIDEGYKRMADAIKTGHKTLMSDITGDAEEALQSIKDAIGTYYDYVEDKLDRDFTTRRRRGGKRREAADRYDLSGEYFAQAQVATLAGDKEGALDLITRARAQLDAVQQLRGRRVNLEKEYYQILQLQLETLGGFTDAGKVQIALQERLNAQRRDGASLESKEIQRARIQEKLLAEQLKQFEELADNREATPEALDAAAARIREIIQKQGIGNEQISLLDPNTQEITEMSINELLQRKLDTAKEELILEQLRTREVERQTELKEAALKKEELAKERETLAAGISENILGGFSDSLKSTKTLSARLRIGTLASEEDAAAGEEALRGLTGAEGARKVDAISRTIASGDPEQLEKAKELIRSLQQEAQVFTKGGGRLGRIFFGEEGFVDFQNKLLEIKQLEADVRGNITANARDKEVAALQEQAKQATAYYGEGTEGAQYYAQLAEEAKKKQEERIGRLGSFGQDLYNVNQDYSAAAATVSDYKSFSERLAAAQGLDIGDTTGLSEADRQRAKDEALLSQLEQLKATQAVGTPAAGISYASRPETFIGNRLTGAGTVAPQFTGAQAGVANNQNLNATINVYDSGNPGLTAEAVHGQLLQSARYGAVAYGQGR